MNSEYQNIFILGAPRSGTTFLASLLSDTIYSAPFESHFITKYFKKIESYGDLDIKKNFEKLVADILNERPVKQYVSEISTDEFYQWLGDNRSYANIVNYICSRMLDGNGGHRSSWGDKTPHYLLDLDIVYHLFPNAKYIYIVRDGRDVALSLLKKDWGPSNIYSCAKLWSNYNSVHSSIVQTLVSQNQLIRVKYEDLASKTEDTISDIYDFLEIELDPDALSLLATSMRKGNHDKWKTVMTSNQKNTFNSVASETLQEFGYEVHKTPVKVSSALRCLYVIHNKLCFFLFLFKANTWDFVKIKYFNMQPFDK
jgi:hypothetical protein